MLVTPGSERVNDQLRRSSKISVKYVSIEAKANTRLLLLVVVKMLQKSLNSVGK